MLMNVLSGNFVASSLTPRLPILVLEVMEEPNKEASGLISALLRGPRDFQASMATDMTARRWTEEKPVLYNRSVTW